MWGHTIHPKISFKFAASRNFVLFANGCSYFTRLIQKKGGREGRGERDRRGLKPTPQDMEAPSMSTSRRWVHRGDGYIEGLDVSAPKGLSCPEQGDLSQAALAAWAEMAIGRPGPLPGF